LNIRTPSHNASSRYLHAAKLEQKETENTEITSRSVNDTQGHNHFICAYFIVTEYATSEHSGEEQLSQLISPFDPVLWVLTIALIILVKSNPLSTHSEHKQFTLNVAELPGKKLTVRDKGSNTPV